MIECGTLLLSCMYIVLKVKGPIRTQRRKSLTLHVKHTEKKYKQTKGIGNMLEG